MVIRILLLILCVSAATAQAAEPIAKGHPVAPNAAGYYPEPAFSSSCDCCNACNFQSAHYCGWRFHELFCPPGDMYLRYEYLPEYGDTYYFRPYNYTVALEHQAIAEQLGDSAANPYGNRLFPSLYRQLEQEAIERELPPMPPALEPARLPLPR